MRKIWSAGVLMAIAIWFVMYAGAPATAVPAAQELTIGALFPLTGSAAVVGATGRNGAQLAVDKVNQAGGVRGVMFRLVAEDDAMQPTTGVNALNKLLTADRPIAIIGPNISSVAMAILDRILEAKVPLLSGALTPELTKRGNPYVFRIRTSDAVSARELVLYAVNEVKFREFGVIYEQSQYGQGGYSTIEATFKELGIQPKVVLTFNPDDQSLSGQVAKLKDAGVRAVVFWGSQPPAALFAREVKQQGLKVQIFGSNAYTDRYVINLAGGAADGVISAVNFIPEATDPQTVAFVKAYRGKHNQDPDGYAAAYWDAVNLIVDAVNAVGPGGEKIAAHLHLLKGYRGVSADFAYHENGELAAGQLIVKIVDGRPQVLVRR